MDQRGLSRGDERDREQGGGWGLGGWGVGGLGGWGVGGMGARGRYVSGRDGEGGGGGGRKKTQDPLFSFSLPTYLLLAMCL